MMVPDPSSLVDRTPGPGVAHVVLSLDNGGLERVVLDLVREGRSAGLRPSVVCMERPGALAAEVEASGAAVFCAGKRPGLDRRVAGRVEGLFRQIRPDVVHSHQVGALFYAGPAARRAGVAAVIHTEHGKHYGERWRTRWLGRLAARHADRFCCVSGDIADEVLAHRVARPGRVHVVPNGIDLGRFGRDDGGDLRRSLGIPGDAAVIGTLGRLNEIKRQDLLIRAVGRLDGAGRGAYLLVVGDGPLMGELRSLAEGLGLADRVRFAGHQAEPGPYLAAMDVFALTSRSEGMPLSVLEAWAAGRPVVASRVGGLPELVEHGANGLLFDPGDEAALAGALGSLIADPGRARAMGAAGEAMVRARYGLDAMAAEYGRHYREALARGEGASG